MNGGGASLRTCAAGATNGARLDAIPGVHCVVPEGTFVAFPDVSQLGVDQDEVARRLLEDHDVAVVLVRRHSSDPARPGICVCRSRRRARSVPAGSTGSRPDFEPWVLRRAPPRHDGSFGAL
jgi:hypothetical protein